MGFNLGFKGLTGHSNLTQTFLRS